MQKVFKVFKWKCSSLKHYFASEHPPERPIFGASDPQEYICWFSWSKTSLSRSLERKQSKVIKEKITGVKSITCIDYF